MKANACDVTWPRKLTTWTLAEYVAAGMSAATVYRRPAAVAAPLGTGGARLHVAVAGRPPKPEVSTAERLSASHWPTSAGPVMVTTGGIRSVGGCRTNVMTGWGPVTQPSAASPGPHAMDTTPALKTTESPGMMVGSVPKITLRSVGVENVQTGHPAPWPFRAQAEGPMRLMVSDMRTAEQSPSTEVRPSEGNRYLARIPSRSLVMCADRMGRIFVVTGISTVTSTGPPRPVPPLSVTVRVMVPATMASL